MNRPYPMEINDLSGFVNYTGKSVQGRGDGWITLCSVHSKNWLFIQNFAKKTIFSSKHSIGIIVQKEAKARLRINDCLIRAGWRFFEVPDAGSSQPEIRPIFFREGVFPEF